MRLPTTQTRRRIVSDSGATAVGLAAAILSWQHIVHVARDYGHQAEWAAYLYPVSVDGLMIVGVVKAADDRANGRLVRPWARIATWLGGLMSISAQLLSAMIYGWIAVAIAIGPSACLIVVTEVMARQGRLRAPQPEPAPAVEPAEPVSALPVPTAPTEPVSAVSVALDGLETPVRARRHRKPKGTGITAIGMEGAVEETASAVTVVG